MHLLVRPQTTLNPPACLVVPVLWHIYPCSAKEWYQPPKPEHPPVPALLLQPHSGCEPTGRQHSNSATTKAPKLPIFPILPNAFNHSDCTTDFKCGTILKLKRVLMHISFNFQIHAELYLPCYVSHSFSIK